MRPRPLRTPGHAALLLLAASAAAQPLSFTRELHPGENPSLVSLLRAETGNLYAGAESDLLPDEGYHTAYQFTLGIRPSLGRTQADLRFTYRLPGIADPGDPHGTVRLDLARDLGARTHVETLFRLDPAASVVSIENALTFDLATDFTLTRRIQQDFGFDGGPEGTPIYEIGATRDLDGNASLHLGFRSTEDENRVGLSFETRF